MSTLTDVSQSQGYRDSVAALLDPGSVAIVGASRSGVGLHALQNFGAMGFSGQLVGVNPRYDEVDGVPCYASIDDVPFVPDAVGLAVARERAVPILRSCAAKGVKGVVVFALGFGETDDVGRALQEELVEVARAAEMALIGPNCQGVINFVRRTALYMDTVHPYEPGAAALIAESGSVLTALVNNRRGVRWSHAVSSGNEAVTDAADLLRQFVDDPSVKVIAAFLETVRRPEVFLEQCDRAYEAGIPVIVHKSGRTIASQEAAKAHTGALALPQRLVRAALERHHVTMVESLEELLETVIAMQSRRRPKGRGVAVLTASGGQIELVDDNIEGTGLLLPAFSPKTRETLEGLLAPFLAPHNPLDWWGTPEPEERVPAIIRAVADDPAVDIVVKVGDFTVGPTGDHMRAADSLAYSREVQKEREELFVVLDGVGGAAEAGDVEDALADGVLVLSGFAEGLQALDHLARFSAPAAKQRATTDLDQQAVHGAWGAITSEVSGGPAALDLMEAAGLDVARRRVVTSREQAVEAAEAIGYPIVAKVTDEAASHKTEQGGVIVGIASEPELLLVVDQLLAAGGQGVLIEEQVTAGVEVIIGVEHRPPLGTFLVVGLGGIWTELLDDVQIRPLGLRTGEAEAMLRSLRGKDVLLGARRGSAVDLKGLVAAIERVDDLALALQGELQSVDLNPLIVTEDRTVVVDALVVRHQASPG